MISMPRELRRNDVWISLIKRTKGWSSSTRLQNEVDGVFCTWRCEGGRERVGLGGTQKHQERAEQGEEGWANWMSEARNLVVSICHLDARERIPINYRSDPSLSPLLSPPPPSAPPPLLSLHLSSPLSHAIPQTPDTLVHSCGISLWIRRSRRSVWTLTGYYENSRVPSNLPGIRATYLGGRAKNLTTVDDPLLVDEHSMYEFPQLERLPYRRLT